MTLVGEQEQWHRKLPTRNNIYRKVNFILPIIFTYLSVKIRLVPIYMDLPILRFHIWRAVKTVFPDIHIQGCAFHWGQAVWHHVQEQGLQVLPLIFFKKEYILKMFNVMRIGSYFDIIMIMKIPVISF